jgi:hypothetical protein
MYTARWCAGIKVQKEAQIAEGYTLQEMCRVEEETGQGQL